MAVTNRHKHSEQHRGIVPEDQLGATAPTAGYVLTASGTGEPDWAAPPATHAAVTLASDADTLLGLTGQQLTLDSQSANLVFAGPTTGSPADPTFRALVDADIPSGIARDSEVTTAVSAHTGDTTDAHDASAISIVDAGNYFTGTDVEAALQELGAIAGGATITTQDEGTPLSTGVTTLNFTGAGVTASGAGATTTVNVPGGGSVATDAIWDAAGDLAVGSGADTAARLAKGAAGANLSTYNGVVAWNGGTSFPASPATGDRYWRSDRAMEFYYDGAQWLSTTEYRIDLSNVDTALQAFSGATGFGRRPAPYSGTYDLWLTRWEMTTRVSTTNDGSKYWSVVLRKITAAVSVTNISTMTTQSDTPDTFVYEGAAIGALLNSGTTRTTLDCSASKTSTPGNLDVYAALYYRLVG